MPALPDPSAAPRRLRRTATGVVTLALLAAGGQKLLVPEPTLTMVNRYLPSPRAVGAAGCLEIALALWLASGRSPKLAPCVAAGAIAGLSLLIVTEVGRDSPLPCGCFPTRVHPADTAAIRHELVLALVRNAFLLTLCGVAFSTADETGPINVLA